MGRVLVTGAAGFVGRTLCDVLTTAGYVVRATLRTAAAQVPRAMESAVIGSIGPDTDWTEALRGVNCVVHLAAKAHLLRGGSPDAFMDTNVHGSRTLAQAAARAGVRRLIYLSSVKVNGEESGNHAYSAADAPRPRDAYAVSKCLAERAMNEVAAAGDLEIAIVRAPLVYGPGVRANFLRLMQSIDRGWPLPLARVNNSRSLVSIWNLCDLLTRLLTSARASGTWMVSDGEDLSTPDLVRRMSRAMGREARLFPVPVPVLYWSAALLGRTEEFTRLCGSLLVDISRTCRELPWSPVVSVDEALARTCAWFLSEGKARAV